MADRDPRIDPKPGDKINVDNAAWVMISRIENGMMYYATKIGAEDGCTPLPSFQRRVSGCEFKRAPV